MFKDKGYNLFSDELCMVMLNTYFNDSLDYSKYSNKRKHCHSKNLLLCRYNIINYGYTPDVLIKSLFNQNLSNRK
jgi:hypothetical protein